MTITMTEIHELMHDFYRRNQRLPNTLLMPASDKAHGLDLSHVGQAMCLNIVFAAVSYPQAAIL